MIKVYNRFKEDHSEDPNNFPIYRPNILSNPYTDIKDRKTAAIYICRDRNEVISNYSHYFDIMYGRNKDFTKAVNEIYEKYKRGETIYLECCCKKYLTTDLVHHDDEIKCHGDVIEKKLKTRLLKEKVEEYKMREEY